MDRDFYFFESLLHLNCHLLRFLEGPDLERKVRRRRNQTRKERRSQGDYPAFTKNVFQANIQSTARAGRGASQRRIGTNRTHLPK